MTGLSGLFLKHLSNCSLNSDPISLSSSSVGRILKPASMALEARRAFPGEVSYSWMIYEIREEVINVWEDRREEWRRTSRRISPTPRRNSSSVSDSLDTRKTKSGRISRDCQVKDYETCTYGKESCNDPVTLLQHRTNH
jgi:hypothetical protein